MSRSFILLAFSIELFSLCACHGGDQQQSEADTCTVDCPPVACTGRCGAFDTGRYRSLFSQLGKTQAEIEARMEQVANHFLDGRDDVNPAAGQWGGERLYYPIGTDMAIIKAPDSQDVLVEGLHSFLMY